MSRPIATAKERNETHEAHEERCWKERCHTNGDDQLIIPPTMFVRSIQAAAKYKSVQIPGKGKSTYTKHFEAGVLCPEPLELGITLDDVEGERLFLDASPGSASGTRVWKIYPCIRKWAGEITFIILDEIITKEVFETHLVDAGQFIGIGRWRPRNGGMYGRYRVKKIEWK